MAKSTNVLKSFFNPRTYAYVKEHIEAYAEVIGFWRWYPDLMFDFLKPETGGITLDIDQRIYLRALVRSTGVYGILNRGYGKCLRKDSLVYTTEGLKEIGSFFNYQNDGKETEYNLDVKVLNREGRTSQVRKGVYSGKKPCLKIKTREGYEVSGTYVHPLLIMNTNGELEYKQLKDIQIGDYVCIARNNNLWGNNVNIDKTKELEGWINSLSQQSRSHLCVKEMPKEINTDIALYLGYLVGDGCLTRDNLIGFTNIDKDILDNFFNFSFKYFGVDYIKRKEGRNENDYLIYDKYLRKYLELLGFGKCNAHNKVIPDCIMSAPKEIVSAFIRGLFDTDGTVDDRVISYTTVSEKLSKQLQVLLLNFGIVSKRSYHTDKKGFHHYNIDITCENADIYMKEIGFSCKRKEARGTKLTQKFHNTNIDIIPYQQQRCVDLVSKGRYGHRSKIRQTIDHICFGDNDLSYYRLKEKLFKYAEENCDYITSELEYNQLKYLYSLHYHYTPVTEVIDEGLHDVYDIQVDDMHSFVSNGFVNHNTMIEVMAGFAICMLYPADRYAVSAQTKENAASVVGEKVDELLRFYPALNNEIAQKKLSKNGAKVIFKNGSYLDILANSQTSKGQRRERLAIEESVLVDNFTFQDALEPIVAVPRKTSGKLAVVDPMENNGQIHFLSTAGFKGTSEYERFLKMIDEMSEGKGPMVITSDWKMSTWFGRGKTLAQMKDTKKNTPVNVFKQNYASQWVGAVTGAIVNYPTMMKIRTLDHTYIATPHDNQEHEFYAGLDIARSENTSNNKSAISVVEVTRDNRGVVQSADLVYITLIPNNWTFEQQAIFVKKVYNNFKFRAIIVDGNGVGAGVVDELCKNNEEYGVSYPAWGVKNEARKTEEKGALKLIYNMKAGSGNNPDVITNFINYVESGILKIVPPVKEEDLKFLTEDNLFTDFLPRKETEEFVSEVFNLRLVINGKSIRIEQVDSKVDKDRYSSVAYVLWYIKNFAETLEARTAFEITNDLKKSFGLLGDNKPKQYSPFGNHFKKNPFGDVRNPFGRRK